MNCDTMGLVFKEKSRTCNIEIDVPDLVEPFVAQNHFKVDPSREAKVRIGYLGDNFRALCETIIVQPRVGYKLSFTRFEEAMTPRQFQSNLPENHEVDLAAVFSLLVIQGHGQHGPLPTTDNTTTVVYVKGYALVYLCWYKSGWGIAADLIDLEERFSGFLVLFRSS